MAKRLVIHAVNIHQGGGAVLLNTLLTTLDNSGQPYYLIVDHRFEYQVPERCERRNIPATLLCRIKAEYHLKKIVQTEDRVLCFGNLPPLFKLKGNVILFLQNIYMLGKLSLHGFSITQRLKLNIERWWFYLFLSNVSKICVQTESTALAFHERFPNKDLLVEVKGFYDSDLRDIIPQATNITFDYDYIYIASGEPHKNHKNLIQAWCELARKNIYPRLAITLSTETFTELCAWIHEKKLQFNLQVTNLGVLPHGTVSSLYQRSQCLVYPSRCESFGLPLLEADSAGLVIVASERDYVRDVVEPAQTFDPESPRSIARAIERNMGNNSQLSKPLTPEESYKVFSVEGQASK